MRRATPPFVRALLVAVVVTGVVTGVVPRSSLAQNPPPLDTGIAPWVSAPGAPGRASQKLLGDKRLPGLFIERVKFPKGSSAPPHTHTIDGYVTVLKGDFTVGFGTTVDSSRVIHVRAGQYIVLPAGVPHYEWFDEETIEQVTGIGPFSTTMVTATERPSIAVRDTSPDAVALAFVEAFSRGDIPALLALADTAIAWYYVNGDSVTSVMRGASGLERLRAGATLRLPGARLSVEALSRTGALVQLRVAAVLALQGAEQVVRGNVVCEVRRGRVTRIWNFPGAG